MYAIDMSRTELEVETDSCIFLNQFKTVVTSKRKKVITIEIKFMQNYNPYTKNLSAVTH